MLSRFPLIPERRRQTDRRTDRIAISISRVSVIKIIIVAAAAVVSNLSLNEFTGAHLLGSLLRRATGDLKDSEGNSDCVYVCGFCLLVGRPLSWVKTFNEESNSSGITYSCSGCGRPHNAYLTAKINKVKDLALIF